MKFIIFSIVASILLFCMFCCNGVENKKVFGKSYDYQREVILKEVKVDTLEIVSTSRELFFPFGWFATPNELLAKYPLVLVSQSKNKNDVSVYRYTLGRNSLSFVLTEDWYDNVIRMMIVNAEIRDNKIKIWDDIYVGMNKKELIHILYGTMPNEQIDKIYSITLISGVLGLWYYYTFNGNKLVSIVIKSDFSID